MSDEVQIHIPEEMGDAIREFDNVYLADVLRLWDCYKQAWHDNYTMVCRFENNDYLVYVDANGLNCKVGPIDTSEIDDSLLELIGVNANEACLCWRHDDRYNRFIGFKKVGMELLMRYW